MSTEHTCPHCHTTALPLILINRMALCPACTKGYRIELDGTTVRPLTGADTADLTRDEHAQMMKARGARRRELGLPQ